MSKRRSNPEREIHRAVVQHLEARKRPGVLFIHVPNAPRNKIAGAILKSLGMRKGASDLILFHNKEFFALEIKAPRGRMSPEQKQFQSDFIAAGGYAMTGYGVDECLSFLSNWDILK